MRALRAFFGLDQPIHVQYVRWLGQRAPGRPGDELADGPPGGPDDHEPAPGHARADARRAMLVALAIGIPLGIVSARRENTRLDHAVRLLSLFSLSIPVFWQATMLILATSLWLDWAPAVDFVSPLTSLRANLAIMALPSLALGTAVAAVFMRMTRSTLLEVMRQDYIRTARAKGLRERGVVWGHALKNSLIPLITVAGVQVGLPPRRRRGDRGGLHAPGRRPPASCGRSSSGTTRWCRGRSSSSACSSCCRTSSSTWSTPTSTRGSAMADALRSARPEPARPRRDGLILVVIVLWRSSPTSSRPTIRRR